MKASKKERELIYSKFGGYCAYSGTILLPNWQVDHVKPIIRDCVGRYQAIRKENHNLDNMVPCQALINHYKGSMELELFRTWYLGGLHKRLKLLPKNPITEKSKKHKSYMLTVASYFGITEDKPFSGKFYFETLNQ